MRADHGKAERLFRAAVTAFCSLTRPSRREIAQLEDLTLPLYDSVSHRGAPLCRRCPFRMPEFAGRAGAAACRRAGRDRRPAAPALERAGRYRPHRAHRPSRHRSRPRHRPPAPPQPDHRPAGQGAAEVSQAGRPHLHLEQPSSDETADRRQRLAGSAAATGKPDAWRGGRSRARQAAHDDAPRGRRGRGADDARIWTRAAAGALRQAARYRAHRRARHFSRRRSPMRSASISARRSRSLANGISTTSSPP